jgi:hypothetical protein
MISSRFLRVALAAMMLGGAVELHADDCVAQNVNVAQPVVFPNHAAGAIASNGSVIGVAKGATDGSNAIYFSTYDQNLSQLTPDVLVASRSAERSMALFWNGTDFGLFYRTPGYELTLQRASANGTLLGPPVTIRLQDSFPDQVYDFAWDPFRQLYLIVVASSEGINPGLYLVGSARDGSIQLDQRITSFLSRLPTPRIAVMSNGTIGILWGFPDLSDAATALTFVTLDSANYPRTAIPIAPAASFPRVATDGSQFLIVFSAPRLSGGSELHMVRASATSTILAGEAKLIAGKGTDIAPVSLLWNAARAEWVLSYLDYPVGFGNFPPDYKLYRFHADGTTIGTTLFSPEPTKNLVASQYPFLPVGFGYLTGTERLYSRSEGSESYLTRQCPLTVVVVPSRTPYVGVPVTFNAVLTGGIGPMTYSWDFGDAVFSTAPAPMHTYVQPASYKLSLFVTDVTGATASYQQTSAVGSDPCGGMSLTIPVAAAIDKPYALPNDTVTFSATTTLPSQPVYTWSFGDGSTAAGATTTHAFAQTGTYSVTVTPSVNGCIASNNAGVTVHIVATKRRRAK